MKSNLTFIIIIIILCILTGSILTIINKLINLTQSVGINNNIHLFHHPFIQTLAMFTDKKEKLLIDLISKNHIDYTPWYFYIPAMADYIASSLSNIGLLLTYASVYQMLRGAVVVFTCILSYFFLNKRYNYNQITGLCLVVVGLIIVGAAAVMTGGNSLQAPNPLVGNILIIVAQLFHSAQFVIEEHLLLKYEVPVLLALGYEGVFGFLTTALLLIPFYFIPGWSFGDKLENALDAFVQIGNSWMIGCSLLVVITAFLLFNYFGVTITQHLGATSRVIVDCVRTLVIWSITLALGWEKFQIAQPIGFVFLLFGFFVYNGLIIFPCFHDNEKIMASFEEIEPLTDPEIKYP